MSKWQKYVNNAMLLTGQVSEAAIHGLDGTRLASTPGLTVSKEQISRLIACITNDDIALKTNGIPIGDLNYTFVRSDPGHSIHGRLGTTAGVVVILNNKVIIIGTFSTGTDPSNCAAVVEKLSEHISKYESTKTLQEV